MQFAIKINDMLSLQGDFSGEWYLSQVITHNSTRVSVQRSPAITLEDYYGKTEQRVQELRKEYPIVTIWKRESKQWSKVD